MAVASATGWQKSVLQELIEITETSEFEHNGRLDILAAYWSEETLRIELEAHHGDDNSSLWTLRFLHVIEQNLSELRHCGLTVWTNDHPMLDQHTTQRYELYFSLAPPDPVAAVGALWRSHRAVVGDWIEFGRYMNHEVDTIELLAGGHGHLATAPESLAVAYEKVLGEYACKPKRIASVVPPAANNAVLAHFSESFVVCRELQAQRHAAEQIVAADTSTATRFRRG